MTELHLKIRKPVPKWLGAAERLYCDAFPPEERRPFGQFLLEPSEKRGPYLHTLLLSKGISDKFAGIVTTWQFDDFMYIEHLATMPDMRGNGIGANVVNSLRSASALRWCSKPSIRRPTILWPSGALASTGDSA